LRACGDVLGGAMVRVLAEDRPRYRRVSPRTYLRKTDYPTWRFEPAFEAFSTQRAELLAVLDRTPRPAWSRVDVVTEANGVRERDVRFYGSWLAGHEREHLEQIRRTVETI